MRRRGSTRQGKGGKERAPRSGGACARSRECEPAQGDDGAVARTDDDLTDEAGSGRIGCGSGRTLAAAAKTRKAYEAAVLEESNAVLREERSITITIWAHKTVPAGTPSSMVHAAYPTSYIRPPETPRETSGDGSIRGVSHQIVLLAALIATRARGARCAVVCCPGVGWLGRRSVLS